MHCDNCQTDFEGGNYCPKCGTEQRKENKTERMKNWKAALLIIVASFAGFWLLSIIGLLVGFLASIVYVLYNRGN